MKQWNIRLLSFFAVVNFGVFGSPSASARSNVPPSASAAQIADAITDDFDELIVAAYSSYTQKRYDDALEKCTKAAALRPEDNRPYAISGLVYMGQWKMKSASEAFAKAISLSPGNKRLYLMKATADRYRNAREDSIAASRKAIELDPQYAEAYAMLGDALSIGSKDPAGTIEAYRTAIKFKPDLLSAYGPLGMHMAVAKDEKGAEEIYRRAVEIDPNRMACRFDLGRLLVKQGRLTEARTLWEGRNSDKDNTFPNFITLLERAEKLQRVTAMLAAKPNDPDALVEMGVIVMDGESWVVDGRQERAIDYFRRALAIKPDLAKAQYAIVKAYIEIADTFNDKNKLVDEELGKLRKMDSKLADELTQYRKTYSGGLKASPSSIDK